MIAPANKTTGAGKEQGTTSADANIASEATPDDNAAPEDGGDLDSDSDPASAADEVASTEPEPQGEAKAVSGTWTDLKLRYVYASLTAAGNGIGPMLMVTASELPGNVKNIKSYNCKPCTDNIEACFCSDTANKDAARCKTSKGNKRIFNIIFNSPADALPAASKEAIQVKADGFPKKSDYTLTAVPAVTDPGYGAAATANSNQGMIISYVQTDPTKSRSSVVGDFKFTGTAPAAVGNDWAATLNIKFVPNALFADTDPEETIQATLSGKVFKAASIATSTCKALPEEYSEPVFE